MMDLESRLAELADALDLGDQELVDDVLARLDETGIDHAPPTGSRRRVWMSAAAVVLVVVAALLAIPASRQAIADWFGLDGVEIDRDPNLTISGDAPEVGSDEVAGPGGLIEVDGALVLVGEIDLSDVGDVDDPLLSKIATDGSAITPVDVGGLPGVWIDGDPHVLVYRSPAGATRTERIAGNTLIWQDGDVIRRVEGFASLRDALAFATDDFHR